MTTSNIMDSTASLSPEMAAARAKLREKYGDSKQLGGKGTPRRKTKKVHKTTGGDDKKLQLTLKRLGSNMIPGIEEVQMIKEDGKVLVFTNPRVHAAPGCNTYVVSGTNEEKEYQQILPDLLRQLNNSGMGMDSSHHGILRTLQKQLDPENIRNLAAGGGGAGFPELNKLAGGATTSPNAASAKAGADDDIVPDMDCNFEAVSKE